MTPAAARVVGVGCFCENHHYLKTPTILSHLLVSAVNHLTCTEPHTHDSSQRCSQYDVITYQHVT